LDVPEVELQSKVKSQYTHHGCTFLIEWECESSAVV
jgi:hypothetical protein